MGEFLGKSKLDNLKTIINYNYFDKYTNNCANYPGITKAKSKLEGTFWINDISDILLNALCYVYIRKENTRINENLCKYLYYWLGSKVFTNLGHTYFFSEVVNTLYGILSEGKLGKVCNPVNYNIRYYNFQKFKDIYDLSEDYDTYKLHFATFKQSFDKDYENTIKSYKFLYNELRKECSMRKTDYNAQYCKAFNDYFTDDKNEEISSWICELKETEEQDEQLEVEHGEDSDKEQIPERFSVEGLQLFSIYRTNKPNYKEYTKTKALHTFRIISSVQYNHNFNYNTKNKHYEFFEKIEDYIEIAKSAESITSFSQAKSGCNSFVQASERYFTDKETAEIICNQFIKLYVSLNNVTCVQNLHPKYIKCSEFLNYWVNFKFRKIMHNEDYSVCDVYNGIEGQFWGNSDININIYDYINSINEDYLYKMNILYNLYQNYVELNAIDYKKPEQDKQKLLILSTACCTDYNKAKYICNGDNKDNNTKFCEKLRAFELKYDELDKNVIAQGYDFSNYFIKLSECRNNKIITTAVTGTVVGLIPLLGVLYKVSELNINL
ncbi:hypothetical protein PVNG_05947 [Plasmodium vivax North Korean]|uniref:Uncharacterized protein n=1 Tax=Plasmodium vivax North Korean TaxID=1035514 RepID=A0A0J9W6A9_PLAVI|nr:hypothetical protein PVNG_05947 [Plasmodium vivax North Korean]